MTSSTATDVNQTEFLRNPFALLGATTRDNRRKIVELADEASLILDHDVCQKARADLTNPRTRLTAEVAWLVGVSPRKADELVSEVRSNPMSLVNRDDVPALAHCNLLTATFQAVDEQLDWERVVDLIEKVIDLLDCVDAQAVLRDINEDRAVSGFPEVRGVEQVEEELGERKRHYRKVVQEALNRLYTDDLISVMTYVVDVATMEGTVHGPEFVDELVDGYAVETNDFLQKEAANIEKLIAFAREKADASDVVLSKIIASLDVVVRNWCKVAMPLMMSSTSRGLDHDPSLRVAFSVRSLAIDLFNDHERLEQAQRLTLLLKEMFGCLPELSERVNADEAVLKGVTERRQGERALKPLLDLCERVKASIEVDPTRGLSEGHQVLDRGMPILRQAGLDEQSANYAEGCDYIAISLMACSIAYGNRTAKWGSVIELLERAREIVRDGKLKERVDENLSIARENHRSYGDLEPIDSAPSLRTINACGFTLYGSTDPIPSNGSYMATYYFVLLAIPIFPLARYRVISTGGGFRFLGKGKLRGFDKAHIVVSVILILIFLSNL